jgi:hypothetical protein
VEREPGASLKPHCFNCSQEASSFKVHGLLVDCILQMPGGEEASHPENAGMDRLHKIVYALKEAGPGVRKSAAAPASYFKQIFIDSRVDYDGDSCE